MKTKIWAHRGASKQAPENTLAAFDLAVRQQADGIELDVQRSADGILVVAHDENCLRLTGQDRPLDQLTFAELRQMNFAAHRPEAGFHTVPTLAEVFDLIRPTGLTINIEMKNSVSLYPGLEEQVLRLAVEQRMQDRIQLSSFNHYSLLLAVRLISQMKLAIPCGPLYDCWLVEPWQYARSHGFAAIHPLYASLQDLPLVSRCHEAGVAVNAWTIDVPEHQALAIRLGIDAIITNLPDQARTILQQMQ